MPVTDIEVRQNVEIIARERGKIVARREGHNIFLNLGREWLAQLIFYTTLPAGAPPPPGPVTTGEDRRIRYMGFGIGSNKGSAGGAPYSTHYPGTQLQTDTDPSVTRLERPVRLTSPVPGSPVLPPYDPDDVWLGQVQAPPSQVTSTSVRFTRVLATTEVSYGPFLAVPLTEILLVLNGADPTVFNNTGVAYETFDPITKTNAIAVEVRWTLRF